MERPKTKSRKRNYFLFFIIVSFVQIVVIILFLFHRSSSGDDNKDLDITHQRDNEDNVFNSKISEDDEIGESKSRGNFGRWQDNEKFIFLPDTIFYPGQGLGIIFQGKIRPGIILHRCFGLPLFLDKKILRTIDHKEHDYLSIFKDHVFFDMETSGIKESEVWNCAISTTETKYIKPEMGWVFENEEEFCSLGCLKDLREEILIKKKDDSSRRRVFRIEIRSFVENYAYEMKRYMIENDWIVDLPKIVQKKDKEEEIWVCTHIRGGDVRIEQSLSLKFDLINTVHKEIIRCLEGIKKVRFFVSTNSNKEQQLKIKNKIKEDVMIIKDKNDILINDFAWAKEMDVLLLAQSSFSSVLYSLNPEGFYLVPEGDPHFPYPEKDPRMFLNNEVKKLCDSIIQQT